MQDKTKGWDTSPVEGFPIWTHNGERHTKHIVMPEATKKFLIDHGAGPTVGLLEIMYQIVMHENLAQILELGTAQGISTRVLCDAAEQLSGGFVSVDMGGFANVVPAFGTFVQAHTGKYDVIKAVLDAKGMDQLDCLFIDADHSASAIQSDFDMYGPLVRRGGIVFFHDICVMDPECEGPIFWNQDFPGWEKFTITWSNGLGILRKK